MRILASPAFANQKVNPYNALLYNEINKIEPVVDEYSHKKALRKDYDILHFHWPDGYINERSAAKAIQRILLLGFIIVVAKSRGRKIVWTVHNIVPHDAFHPRLSQAFMNWFVQRCNGLIFMSEQSRSTFMNHYQPKASIRSSIIPHGHYRNSYPPAIAGNLAKQRLGLPQDKQILLCFGMVKPYKNIDRLIEVFIAAGLNDIILVIAGSPESPALAKQLVEIGGDRENVKLFLKFIDDDELSLYHSAADIVILPYKSILNSGALLLALSFNKPVIAPHIGTFVILQQELGPQWVHSYEDDLHPDALISALDALKKEPRPPVCPLTNYDWDRLAGSTYNFYKSLL